MPQTYQQNEPSIEDLLAQVNQQESRLLELANQLDAIRRSENNPFSSQPPPFITDTVPLAQSVEIIQATQEVGTTHVAMRWVKPPRNDIERFEIWAKNVAFSSEQPFKVTDATDAPATFSLTADADTGVVLYVRTVLKNGLSSDLNSSPSVATSITLADPTITSASQIANGIIGDAKLDRITDPISIVTADIANLAVTNAKIANLAVDNAKINDLAATKITAGTLAAGVILASNIAATQINAGTMSAVNVSAGTYTLTSGNEVMAIEGTNGFYQHNTATGDEVRIFGGGIRTYNSGTIYTELAAGGNGGVLDIRNTSGTIKIQAEVNGSGDGQISINGTKVLGVQGSAVTTVSGTAGATYTSTEQTLINDLVTAVNAIISRLQGHGLIA